VREYSIDEPVELSGEWFLPDRPDRRIPGTLRYEPGNGTLHLSGTLSEVQGSLGVEYPTVLGITDRGLPVSLPATFRVGWSFDSGQERERILTNWVLIGAHVAESARFASMKWRIPGLESWLCRPLVSEAAATEESGVRVVRFEAKVYPPDVTRLERHGANLEWSVTGKVDRDTAGTRASLASKGWINLVPCCPQELKWLLERQYEISMFLALLAGSAMGPDYVQIRCEDNTPVDVLYPRRGDTCTFTDLHDYFLRRDLIGMGLSEAVARWSALVSMAQTATQLAVDVLTEKSRTITHEFLGLMWALESFHRAALGGSYITEEAFQPIAAVLIATIPDGLESSHRSALKSRIEWGFEFSLRKRLNDIVGRLAPEVRQLIFGRDTDSVPNSWIATRNHFTHWDEGSRSEDVLEGARLVEANVRLRNLLRCSFLTRLEIPTAAILMGLKGNHRDSHRLEQFNRRL
jgi:hypothetical protein